MARYVVVDPERNVGVAYETEEEAFKAGEPVFKKAFGWSDEEWNEFDDQCKRDYAGCLISDEGGIGVWQGFDSGDRCSFTCPLPMTEEDFPGWGSGDPFIYKTVGQPIGVEVNGELYQPDEDDKTYIHE